ncbi:hypothetical protein K4L44_14330 [Halosquirtibacter laminarini]|uniref:Uncharacterized protein n=1 Tax=Halosquirtibacter laminarini TaxID=3374600 RepID=A0AC61NMF4_9BACT|nr:hypothetical protein K4L44_14330 [Prolixibacteraceae bacterium]
MKNILVTIFLTFYLLGTSMMANGLEKNKDYKSFFFDNLYMPVNARVDFNELHYEEDYKVFQDQQRFQMSNLIFGINGLLSNNVGFNFQTVYNSTQLNYNGILENIQCANVTYTTNDAHWFFSLGRFFLNVGTAEQSYNPSDVPMYSVIGNNLGVYKTGATFQYTTNTKQSFGLQVVNADNPDYEQNMEYNIYWYGHILPDKILTYMSFTTIQNSEVSRTPYAVNLGLQWLFGDIAIDTDYARVKNMTNFYTDATYTSVPIKLAYNGRHFRPYLKYIYNEVDFGDESFDIELEDGTSQTIVNTAAHTIELALQYYPFDNKNFRFHLVGGYTSDGNISVSAPEGSANNSRQHYNAKYQILAGICVNFDLLKGW